MGIGISGMDLPVHLALFQRKGVEEKKLEPGMQSTGGRRFNTLCPYSTTPPPPPFPPPPPSPTPTQREKRPRKKSGDGDYKMLEAGVLEPRYTPPPSLLLSCKMSVAVTYHNTSSQHDPFTHLPYH